MAIILRSDRKMFMGANSGSSTTYSRLKGFTSLSESKNSKEYSRQYVDEVQEVTDVTGYSASYDFTFDLLSPNAVLTDLAEIIDGEAIGSEAERDFVSVDFHKPVSGGGFEAVKRTYSVIGGTVADGTDALTYNGTLKVKTGIVKGVATITSPLDGDSETVETITFTELDEE